MVEIVLCKYLEIHCVYTLNSSQKVITILSLGILSNNQNTTARTTAMQSQANWDYQCIETIHVLV